MRRIAIILFSVLCMSFALTNHTYACDCEKGKKEACTHKKGCHCKKCMHKSKKGNKPETKQETAPITPDATH